MTGKLLRVMLLVVVVMALSLVWAGSVGAKMTEGTGPDDAMMPGDWAPILKGERHWFAFTYDKHAADPQIQIKLYGKPQNDVEFYVLTPEQAQHWRATGEVKWIGAGAINKNVSGEPLFWTGQFNTSGTYYVAVEHGDLFAAPAYCKLVVTGEATQ
jgi:hypothetical protein